MVGQILEDPFSIAKDKAYHGSLTSVHLQSPGCRQFSQNASALAKRNVDIAKLYVKTQVQTRAWSGRFIKKLGRPLMFSRWLTFVVFFFGAGYSVCFVSVVRRNLAGNIAALSSLRPELQWLPARDESEARLAILAWQA